MKSRWKNLLWRSVKIKNSVIGYTWKWSDNKKEEAPETYGEGSLKTANLTCLSRKRLSGWSHPLITEPVTGLVSGVRSGKSLEFDILKNRICNVM